MKDKVKVVLLVLFAFGVGILMFNLETCRINKVIEKNQKKVEKQQKEAVNESVERKLRVNAVKKVLKSDASKKDKLKKIRDVLNKK